MYVSSQLPGYSKRLLGMERRFERRAPKGVGTDPSTVVPQAPGIGPPSFSSWENTVRCVHVNNPAPLPRDEAVMNLTQTAALAVMLKSIALLYAP